MGTVITKTYPAPTVDKKAVMRYAAAKEFDAETEKLYFDCLDTCLINTVYRVCYRELPVVFYDNAVRIGDAEIRSKDLKKSLETCHSAVVFAATVGLEYDRLIKGYGRHNAAKALIFQAIGTERVEALCDAFCSDIANEKLATGDTTTPRFSPGYGDLPLNIQKKIFELLNCESNIGVFLNESLLMTPSKSVTAIIGIKKHIL